MRRLAALAFLAIALHGGYAYADSVRMFSVVATLESGSVAGTVTLDALSGIFVEAELTGMYQGTAFSFSGAPILYDVGYGYTRTHYGTSALAFGINLPTAMLVNYSGGDLCSIANLCAGSISSGVGTASTTMLDAVLSGSLIPLGNVVTPEPSSLVLLATGLFGIVRSGRRRTHRQDSANNLSLPD